MYFDPVPSLITSPYVLFPFFSSFCLLIVSLLLSYNRFLESSYQGQYAVFDFQSLSYFTQCNDFQIHILSVNDKILFFCMAEKNYLSIGCLSIYLSIYIFLATHLVIVQFQVLGWFPVLVILICALINMGMQMSLWCANFNSFRYIPRSSIVSSNGSSSSDF